MWATCPHKTATQRADPQLHLKLMPFRVNFENGTGTGHLETECYNQDPAYNTD